MSIFDEAAADILEGLTDAVLVTYQPKVGAPFDVFLRPLSPFVEVDAEQNKVMARDYHFSGPLSALSDARTGDTLVHGTEIWKVVRPKAQAPFMNLQVIRVVEPSDGSS